MPTRLEKLKKCTSKPDFARLLGVDPVFLTRVVYIRNTEKLYTEFKIKKKNGDDRIISAPDKELKEIQSKLSKLLLDCLDNIRSSLEIDNNFSHGFERKKSIISNAEKHKRKKWILNIDLKNFFDEFNYGRVRGYFLKNNYFSLNENICNLIAKIACYKNKLPQGSPCSPVITNLILLSLDRRLNQICKNSGCTYTRYADDITISTNKSIFPKKIISSYEENSITLGKKFINEIISSGFTLNEKKIRLHGTTHRQEVTGLTVNQFVNVENKYARKVRAMVHSLFTKGEFYLIDKVTQEARLGTVNELTGMLGFIDSLDKYNNKILKNTIKQSNFNIELNKREKIYANFLYFKSFYFNAKPVLLTEGKTDITYLRVALDSLAYKYPDLIGYKENGRNKIRDYKLTFFKNSPKTKYLLNLDGGSSHLKEFLNNFEKKARIYKTSGEINPVIIILDNDSGSGGNNGIFESLMNKLRGKISSKEELRSKKWIWVTQNLYIIFTPLNGKKESSMEDLFDKDTLNIKLGGKVFNRTNSKCTAEQYGKEVFANGVVLKKRKSINFSGFSPIFDAISEIITYHNSSK
ncbi:retron Ec67 family RNA-directed DNA polymerase/endonuclease [Providencia rettgeri]|uniref:retron Ec67 family RNA-directed DNA polymerase/endonuclease n=1 Tax=Providencia rettgeri TaxID=587 RepID=UPI00226E3F97|nr:retron Ec67 family RNA-directed DNA polymerase/endonuclease [Providencia rettgeri]ELH9582562.1 retron Ec67 family RNA-directed DNA polymerase/endonuclease [Providencia rettgeri]ELM3936173.1 retron Ec67 family RNA-directed DNA polymerase/endonuclease [Providencia rettgeri]EMA4643924.1 retron Ec67 family RNA-directed DNA polymerase/endonuclease [Providencia rettgeri]MCX9095273.1 retron Ec67 family RNA-directed DNA polymerase/endonuclease [Providencia rettgeri]WRR95371.1 retron Ec67 family RNA